MKVNPLNLKKIILGDSNKKLSKSKNEKSFDILKADTDRNKSYNSFRNHKIKSESKE